MSDLMTAEKRGPGVILITYMSASGKCYPSADTIGQGVGMSSRTVRRAIISLVKKGILDFIC